MNNWWDILGVEQDADLRSIKRAYAAKLKTIRQDETPQEFMELRAAYEEAQGEVRYREMHSENTQEQSYDVVEITEAALRDVLKEDEVHGRSLGSAQEAFPDATPDLDWDTDHEVEQTPSAQQYAPVVEQLMNDVEVLIKSPWGAGNVESWAALLDDERLDDIDAYTDFETAMLNYLLNIHSFFDEDVDIAPKLNRDVAKLLFVRFGWQEKRNSVHVNPMVFDWLANKFFAPRKGDAFTHVNKLPPDTDFGNNSYTNNQDYSGRPKRKPTPALDKFTRWFDGNGKVYLVVLSVTVFALIMWLSPSSSSVKANNDILNSPSWINASCEVWETLLTDFDKKHAIQGSEYDATEFSSDLKALQKQVENIDLGSSGKKAPEFNLGPPKKNSIGVERVDSPEVNPFGVDKLDIEGIEIGIGIDLLSDSDKASRLILVKQLAKCNDAKSMTFQTK